MFYNIGPGIASEKRFAKFSSIASSGGGDDNDDNNLIL